jgi:hypothetical protein
LNIQGYCNLHHQSGKKITHVIDVDQKKNPEKYIGFLYTNLFYHLIAKHRRLDWYN